MHQDQIKQNLQMCKVLGEHLLNITEQDVFRKPEMIEHFNDPSLPISMVINTPNKKNQILLFINKKKEFKWRVPSTWFQAYHVYFRLDPDDIDSPIFDVSSSLDKTTNKRVWNHVYELAERIKSNYEIDLEKRILKLLTENKDESDTNLKK